MFRRGRRFLSGNLAYKIYNLPTLTSSFSLISSPLTAIPLISDLCGVLSLPTLGVSVNYSSCQRKFRPYARAHAVQAHPQMPPFSIFLIGDISRWVSKDIAPIRVRHLLVKFKMSLLRLKARRRQSPVTAKGTSGSNSHHRYANPHYENDIMKHSRSRNNLDRFRLLGPSEWPV